MNYAPGQLTDWVLTDDCPPAHVGEYYASVIKAKDLIRWWNGQYWSEPYTDKFSEESKKRLRRKRAITPEYTIYYRGLRAKPRVYSIHYLRPLK
jgi:hypothetical protein